MKTRFYKLQIVVLGIVVAAVAAVSSALLLPARSAAGVSPTPVEVMNAPTVLPINYRFKGFTTGTYNGSAGLITMDKDCAALYGGNARV